MEIIEHINFWEVLGPIIATLATVLALFGNPFNDNKKGIKRLNVIGIIILILGVIGFYVTIKSTVQSNRTNSETIGIFNDNFDSIKGQNKVLLNNDSIEHVKSDSLNIIINALRVQLVDITTLELKQARIAKKEHQKILRDNLKLDLQMNIDLVISFKKLKLNNFKKRDEFLTGKYQYEGLKDGLELPLEYKIKDQLRVCIELIKITNELLEYTSKLKAGQKDTNINTIIRYNKQLEGLFELLNTLIK